MLLLNTLIEQRIAAARDAGELDDLPGAGKPLDLDDDRLVPEDVRVAHRILKNAGYLPPEVVRRREIASVAALLRHAGGGTDCTRAATRLALLKTMLETGGRTLASSGDYDDRLVAALRHPETDTRTPDD